METGHIYMVLLLMPKHIFLSSNSKKMTTSKQYKNTPSKLSHLKCIPLIAPHLLGLSYLSIIGHETGILSKRLMTDVCTASILRQSELLHLSVSP